jgi:hypothetical protein
MIDVPLGRYENHIVAGHHAYLINQIKNQIGEIKNHNYHLF